LVAIEYGYEGGNKEMPTLMDADVQKMCTLLEIPADWGDNEVFAVLIEAIKTHAAKDHDYTGGGVPLSNFTESEEYGMPGWLSVMNRLMDKVSRVKGLVKNELTQKKAAVQDEPLTQTLLDLAVYSAIMRVLYERAQRERIVNETLSRRELPATEEF